MTSLLLVSIALTVTVWFQFLSSAVADTCFWNGNEYQDGDQFSPDSCSIAICSQGQITLSFVDCAEVLCVDAVQNPGECCARCPRGENCHTSDGRIIPAKEEVRINATTTCSCPKPGAGLPRLQALCTASLS